MKDTNKKIDTIEALLGEEEPKSVEQPSASGNDYPETYARGLAKGVPYVGSYSDEVEGAARAALEAIKQKDYSKFFDERKKQTELARKREAELSEKNPLTYGAGIATNILLPYGAIAKAPGVVGKVGQYLFPTGIGGKILAGGGQGAIYQHGLETEDTPEARLNVAQAAAGGAGMGAISKVPSEGTLQTGLGVLLGPKKETMQRYLERKEQVNKSLPYEDISVRADMDVDKLFSDVSKGSGAAYDVLDKSKRTINLRDAISRIDESIKNLSVSGDVTTQGQSALNELRNQRANLISKFSLPEEKQAASGTMQPPKQKDPWVETLNTYFRKESGTPEGVGTPAKSVKDSRTNVEIPIGKAKEYVQGLDKLIDWDSPFNPAAKKEIKGLRASIDERLKQDPEYRSAMEGVSGKASLAGDIKTQFGKEPRKSIESALRATFSRRGVPLEKREALDRLAKEYTPEFGSYLEQAKDYATKEAFERSNANGSRNVNFARAIGRAVEGVFGKESTGTGEAIGGGVGYASDKYGPAWAKNALDFQLYLNKMPGIGQALRLAGQRGYKNMILTDTALREISPEYKKLSESLESSVPSNTQQSDKKIETIEDLLGE